MQRCPTCDFVYEEGQRYCDMDGTVLAHDPNELPRNKPFPKQRVRPFYRLLAICAIPNAILAGLLFYGASHPAAQSFAPPSEPVSVTSAPESLNITSASEPVSVTSDSEPAKVAAEQVNQTAESTGKDLESSVNAEGLSEGKREEKAEPSKGSDDDSLSNSPEPRNPPATGKPANARRGPAPKQNSKIENFIKKTGRMLKKPFKF
jgi:hypothetical protein